MIDNHATANWFSKPGDSVRAIMQRRGISAFDLAQHFDDGIESVRSLFDGSLHIDETTASTLSSVLGATVKFWLKRQQNFDIAVERALELAIETNQADILLRLPAPGRRVGGRLSQERRAVELRKRLIFYNVPNAESWTSRYGRIVGETDYRATQTFAAQEDSTLLWLRRGELEADMINTRPWSPDNLRDRIPDIRKLTLIRRPELFIPKLRQLCAEVGIALAVVKAPKGCRASGAVRMVDPDKAMLLLSFRYKRDDQFWFTVFHEIGHLILHNASTFIDGDSVPENEVREEEANMFAAQCIIPPLREAELERIPPRKKDIIRFSISLGISPGLTVGQMQHRGMIEHSSMNYLKRTWDWNEINPATA
jgi:HTH-type transcriptional regulator/antitoxin HigA